MFSHFKRTGLLCVVSGPSGVGKSTLCRQQCQLPGYVYSVSCTTRPPREGEVNGKDYHFLSQEEFDDRVSRNQFLEHATVHGRSYGTLKSTVIGHLNSGKDVLMDLDVQGAEMIRQCDDSEIQRALIDVFVMPPGLAELHRRLVNRSTESKEQLDLRMENARMEMQHWDQYVYLITSGTRQEDRVAFEAILEAERRRVTRLFLPGARREA